jgi:hypothetical protein
MVKARHVLKHEWDVIAEPIFLARAVIRVCDRFGAEGKKVGADLYMHNRRFFENHALPSIITLWCDETGRQPEEFPWSADFVSRTWMDWRKALEHVKPQIRERCGLLAAEAPPPTDLFGEPSV